MTLERPVRGPSSGASSIGGPYRRSEWWVDPAETLDLCRALLDGDEGTTARFDDRRVEVPDGVVDLFVCTHGRRDACCGSTGAALHDRIAQRLSTIDPTGDRLRLWRVSHTGGHRFAPTALTFPDGYAWAHLDAEQAIGLAFRTIDPSMLRGHCRGTASRAGAPSQAADGAALVEVGWDWLDAERSVVVTGFDRRSLRTELLVEGRWAGGRSEAFVVGVEVDRHVPQITCGELDGPEYLVEPVWRVTSIVPT
jgi:hypothetical protein